MRKKENKGCHALRAHVLLGGGGIKGLSHLGFLTALEELGVEAQSITGVSIGSMIAALATNGYEAGRLSEIFQQELEKLNPSKLTRSMLLPQALERLIYRSEPFSLRQFMEDLVKRYNLVQNDRLCIMAFDICTLKPVVFEGTDYNLAEALTASCALPYLFRPVVKKGHVYFDGGVYHPNPGNLGKGPYLISRLGHAVNAPKEKLSRGDTILHNGEKLAKRIYAPKNPTGHLLVDVSDPAVATMTFGLSKKPPGELSIICR